MPQATDAIDPLLAIGPSFDQPGRGERFQLERNRPHRHIGHGVVDVTDGPFAAPEQAQNLAAPGRRDGGQQRAIHERIFRSN